MEEGLGVDVRVGPRRVTSKRRIRYRNSRWEVREFESGVCRGGVVRVAGSVLAWAGPSPPAAGGPALGSLALAVPAAGATPLLGGAGEETAPGVARRLAARLRRPVYIALGHTFDRFTLPLVENALLAQITQMTALGDD